jgi:hypothetical protein
MRGFLIALLSVLLVVFGYCYWNYYKVYSDGSREGILFKISRKGDIFKTFEGEIQQPGLRSLSTGGLNTNNLFFSVENKAIADSLNACLGKTVKVHYTQYRKSLPWRGENYDGKNGEKGQYIVDKIEEVRETTPTPQF